MLAEVIGTPAMLEQTAEECVELANVCLKYAKYLRGENSISNLSLNLLEELTEEAADVLICLTELNNQKLIDDVELESTSKYRYDRMQQRIVSR